MSYADDVFIKMCQDILENGTSTVRCADKLIPETDLRHTIIRIRQKKLWYL